PDRQRSGAVRWTGRRVGPSRLRHAPAKIGKVVLRRVSVSHRTVDTQNGGDSHEPSRLRARKLGGCPARVKQTWAQNPATKAAFPMPRHAGSAGSRDEKYRS